MPSTTGYDIVRDALRECGVLDPIEAGDDEILANGLTVANDLLDSWSQNELTISGITRAVESLTSGVQEYTIGDGATFDRPYPQAIQRWSVIPVRAAAQPLEIPHGRPLNDDQWQNIRVKNTSGAFPTRMWFDRAIDEDGYGRCSFWPKPNVSTVDVVLYLFQQEVSELDASTTTYVMLRGKARAIKLSLAKEFAMSGRFSVPPDTAAKVVTRANEAFGDFQRGNHKPRVSPIRSEFAMLGNRRRGMSGNIYTTDK